MKHKKTSRINVKTKTSRKTTRSQTSSKNPRVRFYKHSIDLYSPYNKTKEECYNDEDSISYEEFKEGDMIVKLKEGGKYHCFEAQTLIKWFKTGKTTNPATRTEISPEIIRQIKALDNNVADISERLVEAINNDDIESIHEIFEENKRGDKRTLINNTIVESSNRSEDLDTKNAIITYFLLWEVAKDGLSLQEFRTKEPLLLSLIQNWEDEADNMFGEQFEEQINDTLYHMYAEDNELRERVSAVLQYLLRNSGYHPDNLLMTYFKMGVEHNDILLVKAVVTVTQRKVISLKRTGIYYNAVLDKCSNLDCRRNFFNALLGFDNISPSFSIFLNNDVQLELLQLLIDKGYKPPSKIYEDILFSYNANDRIKYYKFFTDNGIASTEYVYQLILQSNMNDEEKYQLFKILLENENPPPDNILSIISKQNKPQLDKLFKLVLQEFKNYGIVPSDKLFKELIKNNDTRLLKILSDEGYKQVETTPKVVEKDIGMLSSILSNISLGGGSKQWPALTKAGQPCKKCLAKGQGNFCHLHS